MKTYAVINGSDVVNTVLWDGEDEWVPPEGQTAELIPAGQIVGIGWKYQAGVFFNPNPPVEPEDQPGG